MLRYRTGDLTIRQTTPPVHDRTINLPRVVFGRTDDMVKVKGVKVYPSEIRSVLLGLDGPSGAYRLTVSAKDGGGDVVTPRVARSSGPSRRAARRRDVT